MGGNRGRGQVYPTGEKSNNGVFTASVAGTVKAINPGDGGGSVVVIQTADGSGVNDTIPAGPTITVQVGDAVAAGAALTNDPNVGGFGQLDAEVVRQRFGEPAARVPGPEHHFLINPFGLMFDEVTASSLVKVDHEGNIIEDPYSMGYNKAGFVIHGCIHQSRPEAQAVLHTHTRAGVAVSAQSEGLLPLSQHALRVINEVTYHGYEGVALDHDERPRLQRDLGTKNHMLLRNHGTLTVGRSVASAFERMYHLERACTMQVRTRMLGPTAYPIENMVIDKNHTLVANQDAMELRSTKLVWPPLLRKLDRLDPSYRN